MTKITVDKALIEQVLNCCEIEPNNEKALSAYDALRAALAEPAVEPCARLHITATDTYPDVEVEVLNGELLQPEMSPVSVYASPPPPAKVPLLTDAEIAEAGKLNVEGDRMLPYSFARAIEQAVRQKAGLK